VRHRAELVRDFHQLLLAHGGSSTVLCCLVCHVQPPDATIAATVLKAAAFFARETTGLTPR
jgi:hypothetical protein